MRDGIISTNKLRIKDDETIMNIHCKDDELKIDKDNTTILSIGNRKSHKTPFHGIQSMRLYHTNQE